MFTKCCCLAIVPQHVLRRKLHKQREHPRLLVLLAGAGCGDVSCLKCCGIQTALQQRWQLLQMESVPTVDWLEHGESIPTGYIATTVPAAFLLKASACVWRCFPMHNKVMMHLSHKM